MREKFSFPFIGRRLNGEKYGKEIFEYRKRRRMDEKNVSWGSQSMKERLSQAMPFPINC
jgi:hypothetical protein